MKLIFNFLIIFSLSLICYNESKTSTRSDSECNFRIRPSCQEQKFCGQCMAIHSCCNWCFNSTFPNKFRCDFLEALQQGECGENSIRKNKKTNVTLEKNTYFSNTYKPSDTIQIMPQLVKVILRKDEPVNISFTYRAVKNYPLDLYFLSDLSYSMKPYLDTLFNLGTGLSTKLKTLTEHYKVAFGSFLDKPGMPFIWTDRDKLENPCKQNGFRCEKTYLFKHALNFTDDLMQFTEKINSSRISANIDNLDGALEAIFQILVCNRKLGWSTQARRIILLSTDSLLHTEGDGLLVGATKVNIEEICLIDDNGNYTDALTYDYPSLGHIKSLLKRHKTNLIVAVTKDKQIPYKKMKKDLLDNEAYVGILQEDNSNILNLIEMGFKNFIRQVEFSVNTSLSPELDVKFYGSCEEMDWNETAGCQNVEENVEKQFILEITLKENVLKTTETIIIKEKNIHDEVEILLEYATAPCECGPSINNKKISCVNGVKDCGTCSCNLGWQGENCTEECLPNLHACRKDAESLTCSGRGDCICGKCICSDNDIGKFCELSCPVYKGKICNGKGTCNNDGKCKCNEPYTKNDCSCENSLKGCRLDKDKPICSNNGKCECNTCKCNDNFKGTYCERSNNNDDENQLCKDYEIIVRDHFQLFDSSNHNTEKNSTSNIIISNNNTKIFDESDKDSFTCQSDDQCIVLYETGRMEKCYVKYCYKKVNETIRLYTQKAPCSYTFEAISYSLGLAIFAAIFFGGVIIILFRKFQLYRADKAEYAKFLKNKNNELNAMNPLYVSPVSEFRNPLIKSN